MIIYGKQTVFYVLEKYPNIIEEIFLTKELDNKLFKKFMDVGVKIIKPDNKKAQGLARCGNHQGFLLRINDYQFANTKDIKKNEFIVVLDGLTDMGNIGAIIRTCYALGVNGIVICGIKNLNMSSIIRTSSGAALDMQISCTSSSIDLANELKQLNYSLVGAKTGGYDIKTIAREPNQKIALFLGNEGSGLSNKLVKKLDLKVSIKMQNKFDSLNVSVATGILVYALK
jgi:23S rRNA (guanosine2251-2'-O)-methyltransferase